MAKDDKLPPPSRGGGRKPAEMMGEDASIYDRLSSLAGQESPEMGGGDEQQAAQMVMSGANQLLQAARMHPALEPMVIQALSILREGVSRMAAGGAPMGGMGGGEETPPRRPRRARPPRQREEEVGSEELAY